MPKSKKNSNNSQKTRKENNEWAQQSKRKNELKVEQQQKRQKLDQNKEQNRIRYDKSGKNEQNWFNTLDEAQFNQMVREHPLQFDLENYYTSPLSRFKQFLVQALQDSNHSVKHYVNQYRAQFPLRGPEFNPEYWRNRRLLAAMNESLVVGNRFHYVTNIHHRGNATCRCSVLTEYEVCRRVSDNEFVAKVIVCDARGIPSWHEPTYALKLKSHQVGDQHTFIFTKWGSGK
jgi:hypothetical protein